eukprot:TRINITY_DN693_c0_g1_i1.p1 TRINITY_DN693_c0_g1~~TRINITY_DN693_c0_g1_i1.p1  ORF type:complete len:1392 (+),score=276.16 TRINITY_DN693_c0_g1_i1:58-4233(+)
MSAPPPGALPPQRTGGMQPPSAQGARPPPGQAPVHASQPPPGMPGAPGMQRPPGAPGALPSGMPAANRPPGMPGAPPSGMPSAHGGPPAGMPGASQAGRPTGMPGAPPGMAPPSAAGAPPGMAPPSAVGAPPGMHSRPSGTPGAPPGTAVPNRPGMTGSLPAGVSTAGAPPAMNRPGMPGAPPASGSPAMNMPGATPVNRPAGVHPTGMPGQPTPSGVPAARSAPPGAQGLPSGPFAGTPGAPPATTTRPPSTGIPPAGMPGAPHPQSGVPPSGARPPNMPGAPSAGGMPGAPTPANRPPGAPPSGMPGAPPTGMPGAPPTGMPGAPPTGMHGAPPSGMPGAPPTGIPPTGAPAAGMPGAPPTGMHAPGIPPTGAPRAGMPGAPPTGAHMPGAPPPANRPAMPGAPPAGMPGAPSGPPAATRPPPGNAPAPGQQATPPARPVMPGAPPGGIPAAAQRPATADGLAGAPGRPPMGVGAPTQPHPGKTMAPPGMHRHPVAEAAPSQGAEPPMAESMEQEQPGAVPRHANVNRPPGVIPPRQPVPGHSSNSKSLGGSGIPFTSPTSPNPSRDTKEAPSAVGRRDFRPQASSSRSKIDSNQIPSPVDQANINVTKVSFKTDRQDAPPKADSQYIAVDAANASPRYMRTSMYSIPPDSDKLRNCGIPWGVAMSPLASVEVGEQKTPCIQTGQNGPIRCKRCRAFINCGVVFENKGRTWSCNMCGVANEVDTDYFANLDPDGIRTDIQERPELSFGSVEWDVQMVPELSYGGNNWDKSKPAPVLPMKQLFIIDISKRSTNALASLSVALQQALEEMAVVHPKCHVAFMTYASSVHFYDMTKPNLPIYMAPDVDDMFVPLPFNKVCWVEIGDKLDVCLEFVERLPHMVNAVDEDGSALGSALVAGELVLDGTGGKIMLTYSQAPTAGAGVFKARDDHKLLATDKEKELWCPAPGWWPEFGVKCAKKQISIDVLAFPMTSCELSTIGSLCGITGGQLYLYANFNHQRDGERLAHQVTRNLTRETGYAGMMLLRTSPGIRVKGYSGHFFQSDPDVVDLAGIDCDKTYTVELEHERKINPTSTTASYLQMALLYTRRDGKRRIRVHTLRLQVAQSIPLIFRYADLETTVALVTRKAIALVETKGLIAARDLIHRTCVDILAGYRQHCAMNSPSGQLVLPEALKLIPIYSLSISKSPCFRPTGGNDSVDERVYQLFNLKTMRLCDIAPYFYPRLYPIHAMPHNCGMFDDEKGVFILPNPEILASDKVNSSGVYLLHDFATDCFYVWVGERASLALQQTLFSAPNGVTIETVQNFSKLISETTSPSTTEGEQTMARWQMASIIQYLNHQRCTSSDGVYLIRERQDQMEGTFFGRFVEDKQGPNLVAHRDYLIMLHKNIQARLK